ncbi:homeobox-leucine zipper protein ATHB-12-like [Fagus crenata]
MASMRKNKNMRGFNDEQIKLLESMFKAESRPESWIKQQLANKVGLHPQQIATLARMKTKQIEREYSILKASYDSLASSFESLTRDNQSLLLQFTSSDFDKYFVVYKELQKLKNILGKPHEKNGNNSESKAVKGDPTSEPKKKPCNLSESVNYNINMFISDANCGDAECTEEETGILNMAEPIGVLVLSNCTTTTIIWPSKD